MTIRQQQLMIGTSTPLIVQGVLCCLLVLMSASVYCGEAEDPTVLYIDETGIPFQALLDKISTSTGYDIELVGEWPDGAVNVKMQSVPLEAGLERIIKELGSVSHALVLDASAKKIRIVRFQDGLEAGGPGPGESPPPLGGGDVNAETATQDVDEAISPPSPDGKPGLTGSQLAAIKADHSVELLSQTGDTEISPPSEFGPGLTLAELEDLKRDYDIAIEDQNESIVISTPSIYGKGLSKGEVEAIKELHRKQTETVGPDTVITEESKYGPGLTLGELEKIKSTHSVKWVSNDTLITPPSKYGSGLSIQEVNQIKARHKLSSVDKKQ